jgi:hypothetical protein
MEAKRRESVALCHRSPLFRFLFANRATALCVVAAAKWRHNKIYAQAAVLAEPATVSAPPSAWLHRTRRLPPHRRRQTYAVLVRAC